MGTVAPVAQGRLRRAKAAYAVHAVPLRQLRTLIAGAEIAPRAGSLVLARIDSLGQHQRLELTNGRRAFLYEGEEVVVCFGNRYAPDQFEAYVPNDLSPCQLAASGGIAGRIAAAHERMKAPTCLTPLGLLGDRNGEPVNLADHALQPRSDSPMPPIFAVVGTAMNAGKSTAAAHLIRGLTAAGYTVGAAKVTGTGAGGDVWRMLDANAAKVLDFTDAGHASTFKVDERAVQQIFLTLTGELAAAGVDAIVVEVADGLYQTETAQLVGSALFRRRVAALVFAAPDALGAKAGVDWLGGRGLTVLAVSGLLTASPLATREAAQAVRLPVLGPGDLANRERVTELFGPLVTATAEVPRPLSVSPAEAAALPASM